MVINNEIISFLRGFPVFISFLLKIVWVGFFFLLKILIEHQNFKNLYELSLVEFVK